MKYDSGMKDHAWLDLLRHYEKNSCDWPRKIQFSNWKNLQKLKSLTEELDVFLHRFEAFYYGEEIDEAIEAKPQFQELLAVHNASRSKNKCNFKKPLQISKWNIFSIESSKFIRLVLVTFRRSIQNIEQLLI